MPPKAYRPTPVLSYMLYPVLIVTLFSLSGFSQTVLANDKWEWDFDHKVSFKKTTLKSGGYTIEIMPKNKTPFSAMATFMFRKSSEICNYEQYSLTDIKGLQSFNEVLGSPNKITPSFKAKVVCSKSE